MKLQEQPKTESEYWETIESLGGFIWRMNHDLGDGRIDDPEGKVAKDIADAQKISKRLVKEASEKFSFIPPWEYPKIEFGQEMPPPPDGKRYYQKWYDTMKKNSDQQAYEGIICSACSLSEGFDQYLSLGGVIPCSVFSGSIYRLNAPHICGMTTISSWSREKVLLIIEEKGGREAVDAFLTKEIELIEQKLNKNCSIIEQKEKQLTN